MPIFRQNRYREHLHLYSARGSNQASIELVGVLSSLEQKFDQAAPSPSSVCNKSHSASLLIQSLHEHRAFIIPKLNYLPKETSPFFALVSPTNCFDHSHTSERMATLNQMDPVAEPDTPSLHQSSSHDDGVEEIASSSASEPPPYARNAPLEDPFRDDANSNGMQKGSKTATNTDAEKGLPKTAILIEAPPAVPTDMVLGEGLPPPLPYQTSGLSRGLQIPSRVSLITWGFSFPKVLPEQGVSREQWQLFKHELERFAYLTMSQGLIIVGCGFLISHFLGIIPG